MPNFAGTNNPLPSQQGAMNFSIQIRNFSPGALKYSLEAVDIRIGTRSIPKFTNADRVSGYLARASGRTCNPKGFPPGTLSDFYGKGETGGTADFSIIYGPPDGEPVRRLRVSLELTIIFPDNGVIEPMFGQVLGYYGSLKEEEDTAI